MKYQAYDLYTRKITIQFFLGALSILFTGAINAQNTEAEDISELPTITVTTGGRAGQLRHPGQPGARRAAVHRVQDGAPGHGDAPGYR